jgi:hypothetical protein
MCKTCWISFMPFNSPCTYNELPWQITFWLKGESTLHPLDIVVTKTKKLHLVFLSTCGHHIWVCS